MSQSAKKKVNPGDTDPAVWVDEYGDVLYRFALARVRSPELAEDLVQETFLNAVKAVKNFKGDSTVQTWLIAILKNKIIDHMRKATRRKEQSTEDLGTDIGKDHFNQFGIWNTFLADWAREPDEALGSKEFFGVFEDCLGKLPERLRQAFMLKTFDNTSSEEICKALEISSSNLWVMMHRARMGLRDCIEKNWINRE